MRALRACRAAWLAGIAALALGHTAPAASAPGPAETPGPFVAPERPMILTRTLRRPLPDGKEVISRRSYEVRFVADGEGFRIDGTLVDVAVEAPPSLAALAAVERGRGDAGMFPMRLDAGGRLLAGSDPQAGESIARALDIVARELGQMRLAAFDMMQAQAFAERFRQRPGISQWPADLFRPASGKHREERTIPLPGGARGHVTVEIEARGQGRGGLLVSLSRTVTTDLDGDLRMTFESWTLSPSG